MKPYLQWVRARAQKLMMPYMAILPVIVEPTNEWGYSLHGSLSLHAH